MSQANDKMNSSTQRHWLYGMNALMLVIIGVVVVGFLFYLGYWSRSSAWASYDCTSSGVNSLSGSTQRLMQEIAERKQTYKIVSMFPGRSDIEKRDNRNPEQDEHRQQILDLLQEYARRSKNLTVEDYGDRPTEELQRQIRELYKNELKPYEDAIGEFDALATRLSDFAQTQAEKVGIAGQKVGTAPRDVQFAGSVQNALREMPEDIDRLKSALKKERNSVLPRWGTLKQVILSGLTESDGINLLATVSDLDKMKQLPMPKAIADYFVSANADFKKMNEEITAYKDKLGKLTDLKVDAVLESLNRNTVVVLGADSAKVISQYELYTSMPNQNGGNTGQTFNGEQAISSAIFAMVRPEKVKVVFVGASSGRGAGIFNDIKDVLKAENFETSDWSPPGPQMPGGPPPEATEPPAQGKGVVWIVFPPEADPQMAQMGMGGPPNPQPFIEATQKHMAAGGQVMFLADSAIANPMMGLSGGGFPYDELVKDFGVDVQSKYTVVNLQEAQDRDTGQNISQASPYIEISRFEDHEITRSMQDLPLMFGPARTQSAPSFVTVVRTASPPPAGVEAKVILKSPSGSDYWGESNFALDAKFDKESDLPSPLPLAVAAIRNKGQKDKDGNSTEQRVIVMGSKQFASDFFLEYAQPVMISGRMVAVPRFPGNSELMKNSVLWLAGYENMIAVSAKANQASRIGNITPMQLSLVRSGTWFGLPLLALALGGAVWFRRHR